MPLVTDRVDLLLDLNNELVIDGDLQFSSGVDAVAQTIRLKLQAFMGEWFIDLTDGVPWYQSILGQKYDQNQLLGILRDPILRVSGVSSIVSLSSIWDPGTRTATISWKVMTKFSDTPVGGTLPVAT